MEDSDEPCTGAQESHKPSEYCESAILNGLNEAQRLAVTCPADVIQILAPPGSGKTKTLTTRAAWLLYTKRVQPWNIIVTTFTVKAAREMKERIGKLIGDGRESKLILGTFHSICLRYLRRYGHFIGLPKNIGVADTSDSTGIIKKVVKDMHCKQDVHALRSRISSCKARGIDPEEEIRTGTNKFRGEEFLKVFRAYEAALARSSLLDYDDLLLRAVELLQKHPECVSNVEYLLVDEYQDTSIVQFDLVRLFAQHNRRITVVGDPDQSIYSFRAAEIENLNRMKVQFPNLEVVILEENYRSAGSILSAAQKVIEQDRDRPKKPLIPTHNTGLRPVLRELPSAGLEAFWIVKEIQRMVATTGNLLCYNDFSILLRSGFQSRLIEAALGKASVPYRMVGGTRFFDRVEIKILLDYMRVVDQPDNDEALKRILNVPARKIGDTSMNKIVDEALSKKLSIWGFIRKWTSGQMDSQKGLGTAARKSVAQFVGIISKGQTLMRGDGIDIVPLVKLLDLVIKELDFKKYLQKNYSENEDWEARWENVEELMVLANDASNLLHPDEEDLEALPQIDRLKQTEFNPVEASLAQFLANISLSTEVRQEGEEYKPNQVTISTIHAAKGLEWGVVFIPGVIQGTIPHSRSENTDEERRLLYVAMTRAKAMLYISKPEKDSRGDSTCGSVFTKELSLDKVGHVIEYSDVKTMSQILDRPCPTSDEVYKACEELETVEDDVGTSRIQFDGREGHHRDGGPNASRFGPPSTMSPHPMPAFQTASSMMADSAKGYSSHTSENLSASRAQSGSHGSNTGSKRRSPFELAQPLSPKRQKAEPKSDVAPTLPTLPKRQTFRPPPKLAALDPHLASHRPRQGAPIAKPSALRKHTSTTDEDQENQPSHSYTFLSSPVKSSPPRSAAVKQPDLADDGLRITRTKDGGDQDRTPLGELAKGGNRGPGPGRIDGQVRKQLGAKARGNGWAERMKRNKT